MRSSQTQRRPAPARLGHRVVPIQCHPPHGENVRAQGARPARLVAEGTRSTAAWDAAHPRATSLARKAAISGVPLAELKEAYDQGWSAWFTAGKPRGLTKQQTAMNKASQLALSRS